MLEQTKLEAATFGAYEVEENAVGWCAFVGTNHGGDSPIGVAIGYDTAETALRAAIENAKAQVQS